jgi:hypothetical protein
LNQFNRVVKKIVTTLVLTVVLAIVAVACGTDAAGSGGSAVSRVVASDRIYSVDDLKAAGAKTVKEYDVEDLPGAMAVWKTVFNQLDYEARFYATHEDAVAQGTSFADSVTGEDAVVTGDDILWEEGKRDRRKCSRAAETPHSSCTYSARYLEYVIRGNMILFCEGNESSDAFENCEDLMKLMNPV